MNGRIAITAMLGAQMGERTEMPMARLHGLRGSFA
jgi:hypothetical protein